MIFKVPVESWTVEATFSVAQVYWLHCISNIIAETVWFHVVNSWYSPLFGCWVILCCTVGGSHYCSKKYCSFLKKTVLLWFQCNMFDEWSETLWITTKCILSPFALSLSEVIIELSTTTTAISVEMVVCYSILLIINSSWVCKGITKTRKIIFNIFYVE